MRSDLRNNQSELVREEGSSHRGANFTHFIQKLGGWFIIFWRNLIRMITTRPMMMMISPSTVVNHHRTALSALDQLEEYGIKEDKTRLQSVMESSSVREENFKTTGLIGTSFPPLIPHTHHQRCSSQQNSASLLTCSSFNAKHHSESDLTGIGILNERSPGEDFIISSTKPSEQIPSKEVTVPEIKTSMEASEETVFTMDEDEPTSENTFTLYSENDKCVITDNDVCKFLLGLEEEKTFDKISWDNKPQESDDSTSSSSTSSPINMSVTSSKFEGTLPTIKASPGSSSSSVNPNIEIKNNEEEFTPLQKKIIDEHPPTKPQPPKKFLVVNDNKGGKLRRAISLKVCTSMEDKTDNQKKIVRFADVLGLDLENTRTYINGIPTVPKSAYLYLRDVELSDTESDTSSRGIGGYTSFSSFRPARSITPPSGSTRSPEQIVAKSGLAPQFTQPGAKNNFQSVVNSLNVCLECAYVSVNGSSLSGVVAVKNISYEKSVTIRFTIDDWHSFMDSDAKYFSSCSVDGVDKFSFDINFPSPISLNQRLQFCIKYNVPNGEFWDNNFGANYIFKSLTKFDQVSLSKKPVQQSERVSQSPSCSEDPWHHFV